MQNNRYPLVILYSGGLDSYVAYWYALSQGYKPSDILLLRIEIDHTYSNKERIALCLLGLPYKTVKLDYLKHFTGITTDNFLIPSRNLLLSALASTMGNIVWLSAYKGEMHLGATDKNAPFMQMASDLFSYVSQQSVSVTTPFLDMDKEDIIRWALANGVDKDRLLSTTSCFHPTELHCGDCVACLRRAVGMIPNGILEFYSQNPFTSNTGRLYDQKHEEATSNKDYTVYSAERIEKHNKAKELFNAEWEHR